MSAALAIFRPQQIHANITPIVFWGIWIAFAGVIVLVLWAKLREVRKRTEAFSQFAMESGYEFFAKPTEKLDQQIADIELQQPRSGLTEFRNVLWGYYGGRRALIADVTVGSGKGRWYTTMMAFEFPEPFPPFFMYPENMLWRLAAKLGYKDIDFDDAPIFSKKFFLHGDDEEGVRQLFTRDVTLAFESGISGSYYVGTSGEWLTVYRATGIEPVASLRELKQSAESVAEAFRKARAARA